MANERMYLLHEPSGYFVYLGKRMGWGWYDAPAYLRDNITKLYELIEYQIAEGNQDAFIICFDNDQRLKHLVYEKHEPTIGWRANILKRAYYTIKYKVIPFIFGGIYKRD